MKMNRRMAGMLAAGVLIAMTATVRADGEGGVASAAAVPTFLGRNVRLECSLQPLMNGDKGVFVVTASPKFTTTTRVKGGDGNTIEFEIKGHIQLLDDDRVYVTFETRVLFDDGNTHAQFNLDSGAILAPGRSYEVGRMGDKVFVMSATYPDETQPPPGTKQAGK